MCLHDYTNATHRSYKPLSSFIYHSELMKVLANIETMAAKEVNGFSSDIETASDTDLENFIISEDRSIREYYLGKKYFDFALATRLLTGSDSGETWPELDVCQ